MKNILRLLLLVGLSSSLFLAGCTARVYGVPKEEWHRMTPAEQQQARKAYDERRRLYEERRLYEAKQRAYEAEQRARQAREETSHHPAPPVHDRAPALIHFTLEGGTVYVAGRHRPFRPVTVALRQGESKRLVLDTTDERKPYHVQLVCSYDKGVLWLSNGKSRVQARQIAYDRGWHRGQQYQNLEVGGAAGLRGGILRVGIGAMPAALSPRAYPDNRNEKPHGQEKKENNCRDDRGRTFRPGREDNCNSPDKAVKQDKRFPAPPAASSGNGTKTSKANGDDAKAEAKAPHRVSNVMDAAAAQAQRKMNNGGNNQSEKKGDPRGQESMPSREKNPPHKETASAKAKGKDKEKQQSGKGKSGECIEDAAAGKKGESGNCEDESVVGKAVAKGKSD